MGILERGKETSRWAVILLAVLLLVTGVLAGCGGSSEGDSRERLLAEGAAAKFAGSRSEGIVSLERQAEGVWTVGLTDVSCWNLDVENFSLDAAGSSGIYGTKCSEEFASSATAALLAKSQGTTVRSLKQRDSGTYDVTLADGACWRLLINTNLVPPGTSLFPVDGTAEPPCL